MVNEGDIYQGETRDVKRTNTDQRCVNEEESETGEDNRDDKTFIDDATSVGVARLI